MYAGIGKGDGEYDTLFDTNKTAVHAYNLPGTYEVTLEVKDAFGLTAVVTQAVEIAFEEIVVETPSLQDQPHEFPFQFNAVEFDPARPYAYLSSREEQRIYFVNVQTGLIEKQFAVPYTPDALFQSLDGTRLYAMLLTIDRSDFVPTDQTRKGVFIEFDLEQQVVTNQLLIDVDPFDFVVSSDGHLFVASFGREQQFITSFDVTTGAFVDQFELDHHHSLELHPSEDRIYATQAYPFRRAEIVQVGLSKRYIWIKLDTRTER